MKQSTAVVLGLGSSGEAASSLLARHGVSVRVLDESDSAEVAARAKKLREAGVDVRLGAFTDDALRFDGEYAELCVVSPGVAQGSAMLRSAIEHGLEIMSELDLGFQFAKCPVIAVTGSNGKSTLVKLIADAMKLIGVGAAPCGNYGTPLSAVAESEELERLVCEVSTFQMEHSRSFAPSTGVLLNLSPNHLDRHGDMTVYSALKAKMFQNMSADDIAIVNEEQVELVRNANPALNIISIGDDGGADYSYANGKVSGPEVQINVEGTFVDNRIMGLTAAAALAVVTENGWDSGYLEEAIRSFDPLEFRMQKVGDLEGIIFINNSKATTLSAVEASLLMTEAPTRLVAGGILKEKDAAFIKKMLVKRVVSAYVYGRAGVKLEEAWSDSVPCSVFDDLRAAVRQAYSDSKSGDIVLFSPGCSSFDQYKSFADRGRDFNRVLEELRRSSR